jgi:hypothetical protein
MREHGNAKLRIEDVKEIYRMVRSGNYTLEAIGDAFGVAKSTVADIKMGRQWGWATKDKIEEQRS